MSNQKQTKKLGVYLDSMINKILYCAFSFFANILITRYLGVEFKGEYTYVLNTASMISILAGMGIYHSIPYFNRKNQDTEQTLFEYMNIFVFQCLFYTFVGILIGVFTPGVRVKFIILLMVLDNVTQQLNMLMLVKDVKKRNRIYLRGAILSLLLNGIIFVLLEKYVLAAVMVTAFVKVYYLISYLVTIHKPISYRALNKNHILQYVKFGYLPMLSYFLITINYKMDVIMLEWFPQVSDAQLSYYSLGVTVADIAWIISDVFKDVIFSKTARGDHYKEIAAAIRVSNAFMCLIVLGMILFGKLFIQIFYGEDFLPAYDITVMLFFGVPLMSWFKILHPLYNAQGKRVFSFVTLLIAALVNIGINGAVIPHWGIEGAAFASIISYAVCGLVYLVTFSRMARLSFWSLFIPRKADFVKIFKAQ
ncbi:MAG: polysaccharide biosynthesis C-terminal domain-containing protein [Lachnospiraceae bacterium]|nr:polysaccharide biosynthesis C-terminal domain-containing protein [Lachnospiraceae bacterium]